MKRIIVSFSIIFFAQLSVAQFLSTNEVLDIREKARKGDMEACATLGYYFESQQMNVGKAVELYQLAASKGNPQGLYRLGYCYESGMGVKKDESKALQYYTLSSDKGYGLAQMVLGGRYQAGLCGLKVDYQKAFSLYTKAAQQNVLGAKTYLAKLYLDGMGVSKDFNKALKLLKEEADLGASLALFTLAQLYENGEGVARDYRKAVTYYEKVAHIYEEADIRIGELYESDQYGMKDLVKAEAYYKKASDLGNTLGECAYGRMLHERGCYKDAYEMFLLAAEDTEQPVAEAMRALSAYFRQGLGGVAKDAAKSKYWMEEAAKHKDVVALDVLKQKIQ